MPFITMIRTDPHSPCISVAKLWERIRGMGAARQYHAGEACDYNTNHDEALLFLLDNAIMPKPMASIAPKITGKELLVTSCASA